MSKSSGLVLPQFGQIVNKLLFSFLWRFSCAFDGKQAKEPRQSELTFGPLMEHHSPYLSNPFSTSFFKNWNLV